MNQHLLNQISKNNFWPELTQSGFTQIQSNKKLRELILNSYDFLKYFFISDSKKDFIFNNSKINTGYYNYSSYYKNGMVDCFSEALYFDPDIFLQSAKNISFDPITELFFDLKSLTIDILNLIETHPSQNQNKTAHNLLTSSFTYRLRLCRSGEMQTPNIIDANQQLRNYSTRIDSGTYGVLRHNPHTDMSVISLLPKATSAGLQYYSVTENSWINIENNDLLLMVGDKLTFLSNGYFSAPYHRVFSIPSNNKIEDRYSLSFFAFLD